MRDGQVTTKLAVQTRRGTKQICQNESCGNPYYDLLRAPAACPYCGSLSAAPVIIRVDFDTVGKLSPQRYNRRTEPPKPLVEMAKSETDEVEPVEEQADEELADPPPSDDLLIEAEDDDATEAIGEATADMA